MSSGSADRVEQHRALLRDLDRADGPLNSDSEHSSRRNSDWFDPENGKIRKDRDQLHRELIREFRAENPAVRCDRRAILLAGPPGAGKTTAQEELFATTGTTAADWRIINSDDFKDRLLTRALEDGSYHSHLTPPVVAAAEAAGEKVWPRERASLVHKESSMLADRARDESLELGENVIIDGTLRDAQAGVELVSLLADNGYDVRVALVDGPREVTEARVAHRWQTGYQAAVDGIPDPEDPDLLTHGGRWVPAHITAALYPDGEDQSISASAAPTVANSSKAVTRFDSYRVSAADATPELVEQRTGKHDDGRWVDITRFADGQHGHPNEPTENAPRLVNPEQAGTASGSTRDASQALDQPGDPSLTGDRQREATTLQEASFPASAGDAVSTPPELGDGSRPYRPAVDPGKTTEPTPEQ